MLCLLCQGQPGSGDFPDRTTVPPPRAERLTPLLRGGDVGAGNRGASLTQMLSSPGAREVTSFSLGHTAKECQNRSLRALLGSQSSVLSPRGPAPWLRVDTSTLAVTLDGHGTVS